MKIYMILNDKLEIINVSSNSDESYLISYKFEDIDFQISLENKNNKIIFKSNDTINIINEKSEALNNIVLEKYGVYFFKINQLDKIVALFTLPLIDEVVYDLQCNNLETITIGSDSKCNIIYKNNLTQPVHAKLVKNKSTNTYTILSEDIKNRIYVNKKLIQKYDLKVGDQVFINGLKIIWMGNFFRINNPNNCILVQGVTTYTSQFNDNSEYDKIIKEYPIDLYKDSDYFYHSLRVYNKLEKEEMEIDAPPSNQMKEEIPFLLTMGTTLVMGASTFLMMYNVVYGLASGTRDFLSVLPQIIMCVAMIIGVLIIPRCLNRYNKKKSLEREALRQKKYSAYLEKKQSEILEILKRQEQILNDNNPNIVECYNVIMKSENINNVNFWSRTNNDSDFLTLRLGTGNLESNLVVNAPSERFTLDEDNLLNDVYKIVDSSKLLHNVPITITLTKNNRVGMLINGLNSSEYLKGLILQLISMQSAYDLKIVLFTSKENEDKWHYLKYLPHLWSDDKSIRFFASTSLEYEAISSYLENEYKSRKEKKNNEESSDIVSPEQDIQQRENAYKNNNPYYLIIDDNYKMSKNYNIIEILMKSVSNYGFSYLGIGNRLKDIPSQCSDFIQINGKKGIISNNNISINDIKSFSPELVSNLDMDKVCQKISNIPIMTKDTLAVLPQSLSFLEMMDVSKIEQLNVLSRWKMNNPVISLSTPIGVHKSGEVFKLDLHEKFHGPHGLIAGMTGSGKSEFIITYILSLIINYHPYEVQFVLIDYKGGGLAGAFENKETGVKIPHLVGTITNLDTSEMNRTLVSIESELKRRQRIFNDVRNQLGEGTIDIYKYQKLYREGVVKEPMAHLFIICDEFAELKAQQPDFMQDLISTSRIGRSLGIHLILATQKPSGVVNDQIWSNSKFKICLKVQDRSDSNEMLKKPDAAMIKEAGRFYLQVGYDDYYDIGQSGWSGAKYIPSESIIKKMDSSIDFVDNIGFSYKNIKDIIKVNNDIDYGDQLTNIVKYIYEISKKEKLTTKQLWLDALPEVISTMALRKKYNYISKPYYINPIIGEYDSPSTQEQKLLTVDLSSKGNTVIWGQTGSGKESLLTTLILSIVTVHNPSEVNLYILDFGTESLKVFNKIPHIGNILTASNNDQIMGLFEFLDNEIERRKNLFADYSGNYNDYCENSGNKLPLITIIINNYDVFSETYSRLSEDIISIFRDGPKYGIVFVVTAVSTNSVRSRMLQYFNNKLTLQLPEATDYRSLLNTPKDLVPKKCFGRGIAVLDDGQFEFQTSIYEDKRKIVGLIRKVSEQMVGAYDTSAMKIPFIPPKVIVSDFTEEVNLSSIPLGYSLKTKQKTYYDLTNIKFLPMITQTMNEETISMVYSFMYFLSKVKNTNITVIDFVSGYENSISNNIKCINNNFDKEIINVYNDIITKKDNDKTNIYFFFGIGQITRLLNEETVNLLSKLFNKDDVSNNYKFILVDTYVSYKKNELETWYRERIDGNSGIWIGPDVGMQLCINTQSVSLDDKKLDLPFMAYAFNNGKCEVIKYIVYEGDINEK